jgi:serine/threonine protein kinase
VRYANICYNNGDKERTSMHSKYIVIIYSITLTPFPCAEYRLIRKLGEGTFSEVIKAESTKTRQKVAIKCMKSVFNSVE